MTRRLGGCLLEAIGTRGRRDGTPDVALAVVVVKGKGILARTGLGS